MIFDFRKRGRLLGPEEFTLLTSKHRNWKEWGGVSGPQEHSSQQVRRTITPHEGDMCGGQ